MAIDCGKIESLGWRARRRVPDTISQLWDMFESGQVRNTPQTHTIQWYQDLDHWQKIIRLVEMYGGILDIEPDAEDKKK